ncbi:MAG: Poly(beta-D-mannuronate) lyase (alginate lyase) [Moraxellaceae bacterium]|nr:Poly(beta-D-mannuronate) lyase (alginate lyase) [Moraxellaceae bacterium]
MIVASTSSLTTAAESPPVPAASAHRESALGSPFGRIAIRTSAERGPGKCPSTPTPYTFALEFPSKYEGSGKARDTLNRDAEDRYKKATRTLQEFESGLSELSDRHVQGQAEAASCALDWLDRWAGAQALMGSANMTGRAVRKWTLSAAAFSFLKIQEAPGLKPEAKARVSSWLRNVAGIVVQEHQHTPAEKINNHYYWAAVAIGAVGIATEDKALLDWSLAGYRRSVRAIDEDGLLPRELARRSRALSYHLYALQPLVMLAEMGRVNGIDLYVENDCALCRLVDRVTEGVADPSYFEQRTGARQIMEDGPDGRAMVWVPIMARACPDDARLQALSDRFRPFSGRRLGGNLTEVYAHTSKELPNAIKTKACNHLWR